MSVERNKEPFSSGDRIKCINDALSGGLLRIGIVYQIKAIRTNGTLYLCGMPDDFFSANRFEFDR